MRRKHIWVWIVCLALVVCGLSVFFLFRSRENDETALTSAPLESAPASTIHSDTGSNESESASREGQTEPAAPSQAINQETRADTSAAAEPSIDAKPPETEIPAASSDTGKSGNDEPDIHETVIAPESSVSPVTEPEESNPSQQESEAESAPDHTDNSTEDNGDVLLPEVP